MLWHCSVFAVVRSILRGEDRGIRTTRTRRNPDKDSSSLAVSLPNSSRMGFENLTILSGYATGRS